jgi:hypothetical protein
MEIKKINLIDGYIDLVQDSTGALNVVKALASVKPVEDVEEEFHLNLKSIVLF